MAIFSDNDTFARALRVKLDGFETDIFSNAGDLGDQCDALILHFLDEPNDQLVETASAIGPTLVIADREHMLDLVDAGCRGFLPVSASLEEIEKALLTILEGGAVVPPDLLGSLLGHLVQRHRQHQAIAEELDELTERERQVFELAARGARKEEIGERLFISPSTARTHLQRIYRKLGVHSQSELMGLANRTGEVEAEEET